MATPPTPPGAPAPDASAKYQGTPVFMAVLNELNLNQDQHLKRQKLIVEIETALTARYGSEVRASPDIHAHVRHTTSGNGFEFDFWCRPNKFAYS